MSVRAMSMSLLSDPRSCMRDAMSALCRGERRTPTKSVYIDLVSHPTACDPARGVQALLFFHPSRALIEERAYLAFGFRKTDFHLLRDTEKTQATDWRKTGRMSAEKRGTGEQLSFQCPHTAARGLQNGRSLTQTGPQTRAQKLTVRRDVASGTVEDSLLLRQR